MLLFIKYQLFGLNSVCEVNTNMSYSSPTRIDRKSELLIIARRSRIRWVKSADISKESDRSVPKALKHTGKIREKTESSRGPSKRKESSFETIQRAFDFLTDIIADGETVDVESLISKIDINEVEDCDENYDETLTEKEHSSSSAMISPDDFTYGMFLECLCSRSAVAVVKSMQQFVSKFETKQRTRTSGQRSGSQYIDDRANYLESLRGAESIWVFLEHISQEIQLSSIPILTASSEHERITKGYCEKFLFFKLYSFTFHSSFEDYFLNEKLFERIQSLSFLRPEHLDIRYLNDSDHTDSAMGPGSITAASKGDKWWLERIEAAVTSLQQLQHATCPEEKVKCIRNLATAIAAAIVKKDRNIQKEDKKSKNDDVTATDTSDDLHITPNLPGADDVLPLLILCVKESNPCNLHSELKYLQLYLHPSLAHGEAGYLITQLASAVNFLETVDAAALTISKEEFRRSIRRCVERLDAAVCTSSSSDRNNDNNNSNNNNDNTIPQSLRSDENEVYASRRDGGAGGSATSHASRFQNGVQDPPQKGSRLGFSGRGVVEVDDEPSLFEFYLRRTAVR